ncbi:alanine racemase [Hyphobacterium sp.]|uniref:alanine racemase n=1 Tax=Hyphobacterium sp. TaxID=2004662 RepID=UPI003BAC1A6C
MSLRPTLTVDLNAIAANYRLMRDRVDPAECSAVIKADGYGLGALPIAERLHQEGCRTFWTAHLHEAVEIRSALANPDVSIFVFNGVGDQSVADFVDNRLTAVLNTVSEIVHWTTAAPGQPVAVHLDTGINRLGLNEADDAVLLEHTNRGLQVRQWVSHLACADEPARQENCRQLDRFLSRLSKLPKATRSLANSSGCFLDKAYHLDLVRPGLALYGAQPIAGRTLPLSIPYRFEAPILQVRAFSAGEAFGYGGTAIATENGYAATVGAGYADGVPRALSNTGHIWVDGIKAPILGRVSMDSTIIDVSDHPAPETLVEQQAEIYGAHLSVDQQAAAAGLLTYELLTRIGGRTERLHVNELADR